MQPEWIIVALLASVSTALVAVSRWWRGKAMVRSGVEQPVAWDGMDVLWIVVVAILLQSLAVAGGPRPLPVEKQLVSSMWSTVAAAVLAVWHLRRRGASWNSLGFTVDDWPTTLRQAFATVALVVAPLLGMAAVLDRIVPYRHPIVEFVDAHRDVVSVALVWLAATVTAPVVEELFFRRILQGWFEKRLAGGMAAADAARLSIAGSALVFALAHLGHGLAWLPLIGFGVVLGYLARQTGSIVPGIIAHALFNAVSVAMLLLQQASSAG